MPKYIIEREIPDAGTLTTQDLQTISQKSCGVLNNMGPQVQWLESFVTDEKSIVFISHRMKRPLRRMPSKADFPLIVFLVSNLLLIRRQRKLN